MSLLSLERAPLLSRILILCGGALVIVVGYWSIATTLAPVAVPEPIPRRGSVQFNPSLDVSKNTVFFGLRPLTDQVVDTSHRGRPNPFVPVPPAPPQPTTTAMATTTFVETQTTVPISSPEILPLPIIQPR